MNTMKPPKTALLEQKALSSDMELVSQDKIVPSILTHL